MILKHRKSALNKEKVDIAYPGNVSNRGPSPGTIGDWRYLKVFDIPQEYARIIAHEMSETLLSL